MSTLPERRGCGWCDLPAYGWARNAAGEDWPSCGGCGTGYVSFMEQPEAREPDPLHAAACLAADEQETRDLATAEQTASLASDAYGAVRALNHATIHRDAIPGPEVYAALGSLKLLGPALDQLLGQLGGGLGRSLEVFDVYESDGADPALRIAEVLDALTEARQHATRIGALLELAQGTVAQQGYRARLRLVPDSDPRCGCDSPRDPHGESFHVTPESRAAAKRRAAELDGE